MKVLWLTNIPSPYRVNFFNELGKLCDLTVLFERVSSTARDKSWENFNANNFRFEILRALFLHGKSNAFCPSVKKYLKKNSFDKIVVTNYSSFTGIYAVHILKIRKIPYIVESDGAFVGNGTGIKEKIKKWIIKDANLCFSTARLHDEYYLHYGAQKGKIVRYPFTSLFNSDILKRPLSSNEKSSLRKKHNIIEKKIIISVGSLIYGKGFDILLTAMNFLPREIGCYIIGDGPSDEYKRMAEKYNLPNVHFISFKLKEELREYYRAADLFVLATRSDVWGLVINEAMAAGLPVITTDKCIAGLELVNDNKIGKIIKSEDAEALSEAIKHYLYNQNFYDSQRILNRIKEYTFEKMALIHIAALSDE